MAAGTRYSDPFTVTGASASVAGEGCSRSQGVRSGDAVAYTLFATRADPGTRVCTVTAGSAAAKVRVTFTAPSKKVRILGFKVNRSEQPGEFSQRYVVTPLNARCSLSHSGIGTAAVDFGHDPDNPPVSRWVEVDTGASTGTLTVTLTCRLAGYADAAAVAAFDVTAPCSQSLTVGAQTTRLTGQWTTACTSQQRGNQQTPYYAKRYTFTLAAASDVAVALAPDNNAPAYLDLVPPAGSGVAPKRAVGLNPRISAEGLPAGAYTIETTHRDPRTAGGFGLTVTAAAVTAPADCTTDLGVLGTERVVSGGAWSASSGCVSSRRGSADSPHYVRYYTFELKSYSNVTVDLESSKNTYLYLLAGHGSGGRVRAQDGDADSTTPNTRVSLDLSAGAYTIEATTYNSGVEGNFTLIAVDPPVRIPVVGEPYSRVFYLRGPWWSRWAHANIPRVQSVTPSPGLSLEVTYWHTSTGAIGVSLSDTPTHADDYTVTSAYLQGNPNDTFTLTIKVICPTETTRQPDRTCLEDFVVEESAALPNGRKRHDVSFAALRGMRQAADEAVSAFRLDCSSIPEAYRLTRNTLVAALVAIQVYEPGPSSLAPHSLMTLGRSDHKNTRTDNDILYSLNNPNGRYGRAFWHPGVGLYQLDEENDFGNKLNHAERAHAKKSADAALDNLHDSYCKDDGVNISTRADAVDHFDDSIDPPIWHGCRNSQCLKVVDEVIEGGLFSDTDNDENRLYLNVDEFITHERGGGVKPRECRWSTSARNDTFTCYMYDIRRAEGSVWLSATPTGTSTRSPLALPFLSFTGYLPGFTPEEERGCTAKNTDLKKFAVFRHEETGYTRTAMVGDVPVERDVDLIAAPQCGKNVRGTFSGTGWWSMDAINGASLVVMPSLVVIR